jgi:hypothetical protein
MATDRGVERDHGGGVVGCRVLAQALMRAVVIDVMHVLVEDGAGVSFVVDQQLVGALHANTADESLGRAVRPRGPGRDLDDVDAFGGEEGVEGGLLPSTQQTPCRPLIEPRGVCVPRSPGGV